MEDLKLFVKNEDQIESLVNSNNFFQTASKWSLGYQSVGCWSWKEEK